MTGPTAGGTVFAGGVTPGELGAGSGGTGAPPRVTHVASAGAAAAEATMTN